MASVEAGRGGPALPFAAPATKKRRRRGTKAEEAEQYERLVHHIRESRLASDKTHRYKDAAHAADISRRGDPGDWTRRLAERAADPHGDLWPLGRLPAGPNPKYASADYTGPISEAPQTYLPIAPRGFKRTTEGRIEILDCDACNHEAAETDATGTAQAHQADWTMAAITGAPELAPTLAAIRRGTADRAKPGSVTGPLYFLLAKHGGHPPLSDFIDAPPPLSFAASSLFPKARKDYLSPLKRHVRAIAEATFERSLAHPVRQIAEIVTDAASIDDNTEDIDWCVYISYHSGIMPSDAQFEQSSKELEIPVAVLRKFVTDWHKRAADEVTQHDMLSPSLASPAPSEERKDAAISMADLAKVGANGDLLRQWHRYSQLLTSVELPADGGFKTPEEARAAVDLVNTYSRVRARQEVIGVTVVPENDEYIRKVSAAATAFYPRPRQQAAITPAQRTEERSGSAEDPCGPTDSAAMSMAQLAKVAEIGDATLLRQCYKYNQLLTALELPEDGRFKSIEEARAGEILVNNYSRARARQAKIGVEVIPKNDEYVGKVKTASTMFYHYSRPDRSSSVSLG